MRANVLDKNSTEFAYQPFRQWHEDHGPCLWVDHDFNETHDVYFGSPLACDWPFSTRQEDRGELYWLKLPNKDFKNG